MIFTAEKDARRVRAAQMFGRHGLEWITDETTVAKMPRKPGRWGFGWADRFVLTSGTGNPIARIKLGDDYQPIVRRCYGFVRWFAQ
jgi:hypothetical protein